MHHRIQQLIIDSLESEVVGVDASELALLKKQLASHLDLENETVRLAEANLKALSGQGMVIQEFLMNVLHRDEQKHRDLLTALDEALAKV